MDMEPYYGPGDPNANQFGKPEPRTPADLADMLARAKALVRDGDRGGERWWLW